MRLLVIDGNSIANRAFFGIKLLTTKDGRYTNAIYGFLNILLSLLKECEPCDTPIIRFITTVFTYAIIVYVTTPSLPI